MAQFNQAFDATQVEPNKPMDVVPNGDYPVVIEASEWKETKKKDGQYLELTLQVVDGPFKGRKLWDRLNLANPSTVAVEIAQQTLSAICHAVGVLKVSDSSQLHGLPLAVKVITKQGDNGPMNEVKGYKKLNTVGGIATPAATAATFAPNTANAPVAAAAPAVAPWLQKKVG